MNITQRDVFFVKLGAALAHQERQKLAADVPAPSVSSTAPVVPAPPMASATAPVVPAPPIGSWAPLNRIRELLKDIKDPDSKTLKELRNPKYINPTTGAIAGGLLGGLVGAIPSAKTKKRKIMNILLGAGLGSGAGALGGYWDPQKPPEPQPPPQSWWNRLMGG